MIGERHRIPRLPASFVLTSFRAICTATIQGLFTTTQQRFKGRSASYRAALTPHCIPCKPCSPICRSSTPKIWRCRRKASSCSRNYKAGRRLAANPNSQVSPTTPAGIVTWSRASDVSRTGIPCCSERRRRRKLNTLKAAGADLARLNDRTTRSRYLVVASPGTGRFCTGVLPVAPRGRISAPIEAKLALHRMPAGN